MNITQKMGGIDLLSDILASFMSARTAAPLMGVTGGIMSWFSSANGVVFPTLIPAVPDVFIKSVDLDANRMEVQVWEGMATDEN